MRKSLLGALALLVALCVPAPSAWADPAASLVGDTTFSSSRSLTVRYSGYKLFEKIFVQQCFKGDHPKFDYGRDCAFDNTALTPLIDRADGTVDIQVFYGDETSGTYPFACGPAKVPGNVSLGTCYIRLVQTSLADYDHDVFFPLTFTGVDAAAGPASTVAAAPTATSAVAAPTSVPVPSSSGGTITVSVKAPKKHLSGFGLVLAAAIVIAAGAGAGAVVTRLRRSRRPLATNR